MLREFQIEFRRELKWRTFLPEIDELVVNPFRNVCTLTECGIVLSQCLYCETLAIFSEQDNGSLGEPG